jgi:hypothetical protein
MAVKPAKNQETVETPNETATPDIAPAPETASTTGNGTTGHKRGPKGPRTTTPLVWSREMQTALVGILRADRRPGEIRTPSVVSYELGKLGVTVTPQQVATFVETQRNKLPKTTTPEFPNGMPVPEWLHLDTVKRQTVDAELWGSLVGS